MSDPSFQNQPLDFDRLGKFLDNVVMRSSVNDESTRAPRAPHASCMAQTAASMADAETRGDFDTIAHTRPQFDALHGHTIHAPKDKTNADKRNRNTYNSRERKVNQELRALAGEGIVRLWFGNQGIIGEQCISAIHSSRWVEVISRLDSSIDSKGSKGSKPGTPSENLTQCLRDCGVVPKKKMDATNGKWSKPVDGMWEFSMEAWLGRQARLQRQYAKNSTGSKRKRADQPDGVDLPATSHTVSKRSRRSTPDAPHVPASAQVLPDCSSAHASFAQVLAAQGPVAPLSEEIFCPLFEDNSENVSVPESEAGAHVASPPELPTATLWLAMRGTERDDAPTADAEHLQQEEEARSGTPAWDDLSPLVDLDGFQ